MSTPLYLLSIPGLRRSDLELMPRLKMIADRGSVASLNPIFPAVTCPVQVSMTSGSLPSEHGVVANGFYWRGNLDEKPYEGVEMWTAWSSVIEKPRIWETLKASNPELKTAVWFPLLAKGCGADFVCTPAPIHNPDGSESLWCYTIPEAMYGDLRDAFGHFPLKHFWGPLANIHGSEWIVSSFLWMAEREAPDFSYIYLPHLDYAAQKFGPDSKEAQHACVELDAQLGRLFDQLDNESASWMIASEYTIQAVDQVTYPNRRLREAGLLSVRLDEQGKERIDFVNSDVWALVDHQFSHLFVKDGNSEVVQKVTQLFTDVEGIDHVLQGDSLTQSGIAHERTGDVVLVSSTNSWQAYYWWQEDSLAPDFARQVDIHNKPGYDPVEMFFDPALMQQHGGGIPLDATLVKGSHGTVQDNSNEGCVLITNQKNLESGSYETAQIAKLVEQHFMD